MLQALESSLQQVLPDATLNAQNIVAEQNLQLHLIDAYYPVQALSPQQAQSVMNTPLYWLFCWASGRVLAQQILQGELDVSNKTVLDFGSGSGVVAIAAAMMGAKKVIASDIDQSSQWAIKANAALNNVKLDVIGDFNDCQEKVDIITVADVLYDKANWPLLDALYAFCPNIVLADSRVKHFSHPNFLHHKQLPGETWPNLGGFDEFDEVNIYYSRKL